MAQSVEWFSAVILGYPLLQYLIIFFGAAFGGELALFALGFLAAQGVLHLFPLIVFSFLGTFSSDTLWFFLGRTVIFSRIISHRYAHKTVSVVAQAVERMSRGDRLWALIFAKFLVGTRVVLIMYVSKTELGLKKFLNYDAIAVLFWLAVVIPIGFISGLGFSYLAEIFHNLYVAIGFILLVVFIIVIIEVWIEKKFIKKI